MPIQQALLRLQARLNPPVHAAGKIALVPEHSHMFPLPLSPIKHLTDHLHLFNVVKTPSFSFRGFKKMLRCSFSEEDYYFFVIRLHRWN
jgi:hypothetical protein